MTHDYKRNGTTTLFAALNALDGLVIGRIMQRHRHQEFIRFLNTIEGFFAKLTPGAEIRCSSLDRRPSGRDQPLHQKLDKEFRPVVWKAEPDKIIAAVR